MHLRRRRVGLIATAVALIGAGGGVAVLALAQHPCGGEWSSVAAPATQPLLLPADANEIAESDHAGASLVLDNARSLAAEVGTLSAVGFDDDLPAGARSPLTTSDDVAVLLGGSSMFAYEGSASGLDLSTGRLMWARTVAADTLSSGVVGGNLVTVTRPYSDSSTLRAPVVTTFDPADGTQVACGRVGTDVPTSGSRLLSETPYAFARVEDDLLLVAPRTAESTAEAEPEARNGTTLAMSRMEPATGQTTWSVDLEVDLVDTVGDVDILGDVILLSTVNADDSQVFVGFLEGGRGAIDPDPVVVAYAAADGRRLWSHEGPAGTSPLLYVHVAGTDPDTGIAVIESARWVGSGQARELHRTLTAVDTAGDQQWSTTVVDAGSPQPGFAAVLGSTVMVHPYGDDTLHAWDITDGSEIWSAPMDLPLRWAERVELDGRWLIPSNNQIEVIDTATGVLGAHPMFGVHGLTLSDERLLVSTWDALLVFDHAASG